MTTYQHVLRSIILSSVLVTIVNGSLIVFNLIRPPTAQAILFIVISAFVVVGVIALALLLVSFLSK